MWQVHMREHHKMCHCLSMLANQTRWMKVQNTFILHCWYIVHENTFLTRCSNALHLLTSLYPVSRVIKKFYGWLCVHLCQQMLPWHLLHVPVSSLISEQGSTISHHDLRFLQADAPVPNLLDFWAVFSQLVDKWCYCEGIHCHCQGVALCGPL